MKTLYCIITVIVCFYLTFEYNVHPLLVYGIAGLLFLLIWGLAAYSKGVHEDNMKAKVNEIRKLYPRAYNAYVTKKGYHVGDYDTSVEILEKISCRGENVWEKEEDEIREAEEKRRKEFEIKSKKWREDAERIRESYPDGYKKWEAERKGKWLYGITDQAISDAESEIGIMDKELKIENWKKDQRAFAKRCRGLRDELLKTFGCYSYNIDLPSSNASAVGNYTIWQLFPHSYCLEEDLDYTYFNLEKVNGQFVKEHKAYLLTTQADAIASFINELNKEEKTSVFFCPVREGWNLDTYLAIYSNIIAGFDDSVDFIETTDPLTETTTVDLSDEKQWLNNIKRRIVIIDVATDNDQMATTCKDVISKVEEKRPLITFISAMKGFSRDEMTKLIDKDNKKREEEAKKKLEKANAKRLLIQSVSSWDTLVDGDLRYSFLFYYYPTTCNFEATEEEWSNRWLVWNFKNTPGKTSPEAHEETLDEVVPMLKDKILSTFEVNSLKYLTLVCIPASSQEKTQARYEEFSNRICGELGMENAYSHITVLEARQERHLGGTNINTGQLRFDEEFFNGKNVLLFDDVITRGDSMRTFKRKMEALGATVIGGLSLGKTKHERPAQTGDAMPFPPIPNIEQDDYGLLF